MTIPTAEEKTRVGAPAKVLDAGPRVGLTSAGADVRRQTFGPNAIADTSGHALGRAPPFPFVSGRRLPLQRVRIDAIKKCARESDLSGAHVTSP
jgi:hypothetical protein